MEPLDVFNKPPTQSIDNSSLSTTKSPEDAPAEPTDSADRPSNKEGEEAQMPDSQEPVDTVSKPSS